ncbi:HpcH/HpaI aldolase [Sterolibacterium denitrificans]|uniref:HpcH/HpaI aldolase n=1 Tax=Sterolibacterium denitrificans TaxID=157592 RepID=A0A7Z7MVU2_9PROT|nr:aldolase/citrate lyase family protein [Sterolibacterium denitrificans]SMB27054.1 HpcH/HpaI aldolase [Sterolibacterium denitrificans]
MNTRLHPADVLYSGSDPARPFPALNACEHYAGSEKLIDKALALQTELGPIFDITCDCEDGAPAGREGEHAAMVAARIMSEANRYGRVGARIHDVTHPHWRDDLEIIVGTAGERIAYIVLPKVRGIDDVLAQYAIVTAVQRKRGHTQRIPLHVLIETPGALREAWQIAALPFVDSLDFGLMDFVSAHHGAIPASAMRTPGQFQHPLVVRAKCEIAAAALGNGIMPAHNVSVEIRDPAVVREDARRAREEFGYLRMWSIHPNQIQPIVDAMRPDFAEVSEAAEILAAAQDADWGPIQHAGKLHDRASFRYYWELLSRALATGMSLPADAQQRFF